MKDKPQLTRAPVVALGVPHAEVAAGTGGQTHSNLPNVITLQEDEELWVTFDTAVVF